MRHKLFFNVVFSGLVFLNVAARAAEVEAVCFTPSENCTPLITGEIGNARQQVLVQAYSFTSPEIVKALIDARKRGVDVRVVLDKSNVCKDGNECEKKSALAIDTLNLANVPVLIDRAHPIAHNKIMVFDSIKVLTGSFNYSRAAEKNAENVLVLKDPELAKRYIANWALHADHSAPYP